MEIALYAAVAENGVIGAKGDMPWRLSTDLQRFKANTLGKPIIMGRKTWESFPKRPLPGRLNIVITRARDFVADGASVAPDFDAALEKARASGANESAIIGGGEIYKLAMPLADRLHITHIDAHIDGDTVFPVIESDIWGPIDSQFVPAGPKDDFATRYVVYQRTNSV